MGQKKAKKMEEDKKLIESIVGTDEKNKAALSKAKNKESNLVLKEMATSVKEAGSGIKMLVENMSASMQDQNDIELMKLTSPSTRERLAKAKAEARICHLEASNRRFEFVSAVTPVTNQLPPEKEKEAVR